MWDWLITFLFDCIRGLEGLLGDWGLAIIVFTVIIRLLLLPLTFKQQKSMAEMQMVTPLLQELQTKYADDPQRLNAEMTKFYAEHKFNPLAGCLPMLVQMPIFFALFSVLRDHVPADASFYGILPSLATSAKDAVGAMGIASASAYVITDLLFGVLTLIPIITSQQGMGE